MLISTLDKCFFYKKFKIVKNVHCPIVFDTQIHAFRTYKIICAHITEQDVSLFINFKQGFLKIKYLTFKLKGTSI